MRKIFSFKKSPILHDEKTGKVQERFVDSQPILNMLSLLEKAGRSHFTEDGVWEICLCALILKEEPDCKVHRILEALPYKDKPMTRADFLNTMANLGYYCRPAKSRLYDIDGRLLPGVFMPGEGDPCIVLGRDGDKQLLFYDPVSKFITTVPPSFDDEGQVWFFQKYDEHRSPTSKFMRKGSGLTWFMSLLKRFNGTFAQILTAGFVLNMIGLLTPLYIMLVYDRVIATGALDILPMLALGVMVAIIFEWKLRVLRSRGLSWFAGRLDNIVGNKIFSHLIGLSPGLIEKASVSAQIARIKTFEAVRDFFSGSVFLSLIEMPFVILSLAAVALIAKNLALIPVAMMFGYLALFYVVRRYVKVQIRLAAKASSARQQFTIETFEKLEGIRSQGLNTKWQEKFRHLLGREMMNHFHLNWLGMIAETLAHGLTVLAAVMTIGFGVHMVWEGEITTGALVATMILVWRILTPFYSLCTMIPRLEQLRNSIHQVNQLMDIYVEAEEAKSYSRLENIKGNLSFHNVSFRYNEGVDYVFSNLDFEIKAGEMMVITGNNGSGKGTILKLFQSLYEPSEGMVRIDGFDIRQLDAPDLRKRIAYVPKRPDFFHDTVIENLRLSNPLVDVDAIEKALDLADARKDVEAMEYGLNTIIGSHKNQQLSSSLAMRLSLARAYLNPSPILLIDDLPNAILTGRAGKNLKDYLVRNRGKKTILFCTHHEEFMKISDKILWLQGLNKYTVGERDIMLKRFNA